MAPTKAHTVANMMNQTISFILSPVPACGGQVLCSVSCILVFQKVQAPSRSIRIPLPPPTDCDSAPVTWIWSSIVKECRGLPAAASGSKIVSLAAVFPGHSGYWPSKEKTKQRSLSVKPAIVRPKLRRQDSNLRPAGYEPAELPTALRRGKPQRHPLLAEASRSGVNDIENAGRDEMLEEEASRLK